MSKRILTILVALVVLAMVPTVAQATAVQVGGVAFPPEFKGQTTNPIFTTNTGAKLQCTKGTISGTLTSAPNAEHAAGAITAGAFTNNTGGPCATDGAFGGTAHIKINASAEAPWLLQVQQPAAESGQITAHLTKAAGSLQFTAQIQIIGFSVTTCEYSVEELQLMGHETGPGNDTLTIEANTFVLEGGNSETCGEEGELTGSFQVEDSEGHPVTLDMT